MPGIGDQLVHDVGDGGGADPLPRVNTWDNRSCEKNSDKIDFRSLRVPTSFDEYCWLGSALSLPSIPVTKLAWKRDLDLGCVRIVHWR